MSMIRKMAARLGQWRSCRRTMHELEDLNDRELNDLGICRADIPQVARNAAYPYL